MNANSTDAMAAMQKVRDANMMKDFMQDPVATLKKVGVDPSGMQVSQTNAKLGAMHSACASVGCGVCASVG